MKDLGAAKRILGMEIKRDIPNGKSYLSQRNFVEKVLHHFNMKDVKFVSTPLATKFKLSRQFCP
jgi:hypothetical protein